MGCLLVLAIASSALGGGPENLMLVVNADSASSKLIANHYIHWRKIPSQNVVYIQGIPDSERMPLKQFKSLILQPVFKAIQSRRLVNSIDYIVYSADFPTAIDNTDHWKKLSARYKNRPADKQPDRRLFTPVASINSLTFYAAAVMTDEPAYMLLDANNYYRKPAEVVLRTPFHGQLQKDYLAAVEGIEDGSPDSLLDAIKTLESLAQKNPAQLAVAYRLAQAFAQQNDLRRAIFWLVRSIGLGWSYRSNTEQDPLFEKIKDQAAFEKILQRIPDQPFDFAPTIGFRSRFSYAANGMVNSVPGQGNRHYLSTVLAVTRNLGNTEAEALASLERSVKADGSKPPGKFFFAKTNDIRSKTRQPQFAQAMAALKSSGQSGEVITSKVPVRERSVLGACIGTPQFNWTQSGSKLLPGAIGDNFTSYGGRMDVPGQTKLSEFLRHGAAGASGTVVEPYAIANKFPHAMLHAHYARGCTLAEAYYQSVAGPMQLLIVGDPLCRPFARAPLINVKGIAANAELKGSIQLEFTSALSAEKVAALQLFVDGRLVHQQSGQRAFSLDTTGLSDGYHEFRIVGQSPGLIGVSGNQIFPVWVNNQNRKVELSCPHEDFLDTDTIPFAAKSNWGDTIGLVHNGRMISKAKGNDVTFAIRADLLGRGPVKLEALALSEESGSSEKAISSYPVSLEIEGRLSQLRRNTNPPQRKKRPKKPAR